MQKLGNKQRELMMGVCYGSHGDGRGYLKGLTDKLERRAMDFQKAVAMLLTRLQNHNTNGCPCCCCRLRGIHVIVGFVMSPISDTFQEHCLIEFTSRLLNNHIRFLSLIIFASNNSGARHLIVFSPYYQSISFLGHLVE